MDNLSEYFSQQDKIKELETTIKTLRVSRSKYKKLYRELAGIEKPPTRTELVKGVLYKVKAGEVTLTQQQIADKFHVSRVYVSELSSNINKELVD